MKRFWLVLLSLGLVLAFSASAMAVDVKFSGSFYAAGMYLDKTNLKKAEGTTNWGSEGVSTAFYYQRLRVQTDFIVSPGLKLVTRFDAMERAWGAPRKAADTALAADSYGTTAENENIAFDWAYIDYASPIGLFQVGLMEDGSTGTIFGNSLTTAGRIKYAYTIGPVSVKADITKVTDNSSTAKTPVTYTDGDKDKYGIEGVYAWKDGRAGMKVSYQNYADNKLLLDYKQQYFQFTPYAIAKIGPVDIQAELNYATGNYKKYGNGTGDVTLSNISGWIDATAAFGPVYFGGTFAYISGDDQATTDKWEGGTLSGGNDWNPCLIMFNTYDRGFWAGSIAGYGNAADTGGMKNAWFGQGRVGVKPFAALDIMASLSYATADKKPWATAGDPTTVYLNSSYGYEFDVTGTYKITNNLSYMLGVGYWFVGDYYKANTTSSLKDEYMLINKLTLTF